MSEAALAPALAMPSAAGSSFYAAMRILPAEKRDAMLAIYAFCRAVDDIADDPVTARSVRHQALEEWRGAIAALYRGEAAPQLQALAPPVRKFGLKEADFIAVIDGMDMDVAADIRAPDIATLDLYCDRVASAVGRLSVRIFGMAEAPGLALAHHLGRALQLTNILRDVDEDAEIGRLYLPRDYLVAAGIVATDPASVLADPRLDSACARLAGDARQHFAQAQAIMDAAPRAQVRAPRMMALVYADVLERLARRGWTAPRARVRTARLSILAALLRYGLL